MTDVCFRQILVPIDFSIHSARALVTANGFAERFSSELTLVHVIDFVPEDVPDTIDLMPLQNFWRSAGRDHLSKFAAAVQSASLRVQQVIALGKPVHEITTLADSAKADLIVIGTHGHGESARERFIDLLDSDISVMTRSGQLERRHLILGSTAERIVRHAACPVLVVRRRDWVTPQSAGSPAIQKILLATDLSANSLKAFPLAGALAQEFAGSLLLSHVLPSTQLSHSLTNVSRLRAEVAGQLTDLRRQYLSAEVSVEVSVVDGAPCEALCHTARLCKCDLIVLSTHGYTGLKHALLGSTAERVVRHAPCPVLVVR